MSTIVTRSGKGSALTFNEVDTNFTNLNTDKYQSGNNVAFGTISGTDLTTTGNTILGNASTDTLNVGNGDLIKDASGNVGIGVTPSAWGSGFKVVQFGAYSSIFDASATTHISQNIYFDGTNYKYINTNFASDYYQYQGTHVWRTSASGTAGNAITWTPAMTLDASGNLLLGTISASGLITANGGVSGALNGSLGATTASTAVVTSINKMAITAPATSSTLAVADGKTFTANKTLTLTGTDSTTMTFPTTSATIARTDAAQTFTGTQRISAGYLGFSTANDDSLIYKPNDTNTGTGTLSIQAGGGSAGYGGGYNLYGHAHATYAGWTMAGISAGSGGKFAVNTQGLGGGTNVFTVDASGNVVANATIKGATTISVGAATPSASGAGITFPATQSASTDANTLDDYEEGTFTATLTAETTPPTTPPTTTGYYTKIGNLVTVSFAFEGVDNTGAVGPVKVTGMPFAKANVALLGSIVNNRGPNQMTSSYISGTTIYQVDYSGAQFNWASTGAGIYMFVTITYQT
jgi:hypothetical protein